jgi:hypothetical protein
MTPFLIFTLSGLAITVLQVEGYRLFLFIKSFPTERVEDYFPAYKR